jgi:membrane-associated protein
LLGNVVPNIDKHIEKVIIVVVFVSILPGIIEYFRARGRAAKSVGEPEKA